MNFAADLLFIKHNDIVKSANNNGLTVLRAIKSNTNEKVPFFAFAYCIIQ